MLIDDTRCTACLECIPYCPMVAITARGELVSIDQDECVECGVCYGAGVCAPEALVRPELSWPRILRAEFSDVSVPFTSPVFSRHPKLATENEMNRGAPLASEDEDLTALGGRGTAEMKTNDVTGRYRRGRAGIGVEMGRPGVGTRFRDVQKVARALALLGVRFEERNPVTDLMTDKSTGTFRDDILNEKVLSCILEFDIPLEMVVTVLEKLKEVAKESDTVFAVDLISVVEKDGSIPTVDAARRANVQVAINGKTNVGLGRPLAEV